MYTMEDNFYVYDPYDGLQEFATIEDAKKYILENCTDPGDGIHPEIESFLILSQVSRVVPTPNDDMDEVFTVNFEDL